MSEQQSVNEERIVCELKDAHGVMRILEVGAYRFLEFGESIEQSCVFMPDPAWLEYDYTRCMLLAALAHPEPQSALFLGLGAGSLVQASLKHLAVDDIEVIELREQLPALAQEHLGFKDDPRVFVRIGDALELIDSAEPADLIFMDLYTDSGPSSAHLAWNFLEKCQQRLQPGGWLIINQWAADDGKPMGAALLRGLYLRHYWELPVREGNVVLLVPKDLEQTLDLERLRDRVRALTPQLGYNLDGLLEGLRQAS